MFAVFSFKVFALRKQFSPGNDNKSLFTLHSQHLLHFHIYGIYNSSTWLLVIASWSSACYSVGKLAAVWSTSTVGRITTGRTIAAAQLSSIVRFSADTHTIEVSTARGIGKGRLTCWNMYVYTFIIFCMVTLILIGQEHNVTFQKLPNPLQI